MENYIDNTPRKYNKNTVLGFVLLFVGLGVLVKQSAFFLFPHWVFSWPFILIIIGLAIGAKNNFQKSNWILLTALGVLFLIPNIIPSLHIVILWPLILVAVGIRMLTRHNQHWNGQNWEKRNDEQFHSFDKNI